MKGHTHKISERRRGSLGTRLGYCTLHSCFLHTDTPTTAVHKTSGQSISNSVVAGSISAVTILCIISYLIGALLYHLISKCCQRKSTQSTRGQPGHLYDEIDLAQGAATNTQSEDSGNRVRGGGESGSSGEKIVTLKNEAYSEVQLTRSRV